MKVFICVFSLLLIGCQRNAVMTNMLNGDEINVQPLINKGYRPIYSNGAIVKLITPSPHIFSNGEKELLDKSFKEWCKSKKLDLNIDILKNTKYKYSYIIIDDPVDVYETDVIIKKQIKKIFIRVCKDSIITPYSSIDWIQNSSD